jgi:hypothetical protein
MCFVKEKFIIQIKSGLLDHSLHTYIQTILFHMTLLSVEGINVKNAFWITDSQQFVFDLCLVIYPIEIILLNYWIVMLRYCIITRITAKTVFSIVNCMIDMLLCFLYTNFNLICSPDLNINTSIYLL